MRQRRTMRLPDGESVVYCPTFQAVWDNLKAQMGDDFKMDENGAVVRSTAIGETFMSIPRTPIPRKFIFDKPFMLTLWKKGAKSPYLTIWIATTDIMVPAKK